MLIRPSPALFKRSVWKGPNLLPITINKNAPIIKTQARSATILPNFLGLRFAVHNGKTYENVFITEEMIGRKLGEFVMTRKRFTYKSSKNK